MGLLCIWSVVGCQKIGGLSGARQVLPSQAGVAISLEELVQNFDQYRVLYSAYFYNPSAILFIPKSQTKYLKPLKGWKPVKNTERLDSLLFKMDVLRPRLRVLQIRKPQTTSLPEILGYLYTPGFASLRPFTNHQGYAIRPVPEQFNPDYHDWNDIFFRW
jgi:hypothetical protein